MLLESEWVLRSAFGFAPEEIMRALRGLTHQPNARCEDSAAVASAVDVLPAGLDFADALYLVSSKLADEGFASFDARFIKRTQRHWPGAAMRTP